MAATSRPPLRSSRPRTRRIRPPRQVVLLSRNAALYSSRRLVEAATARGLQARVVDTLHCSVLVGGRKPGLVYEGQLLGNIDVAVPRIGASITGHGLAVVQQLEIAGIPVLNSAHGIAGSRDKLRCLQLLAAQGLAVPRSMLVNADVDLRDAVRRVGGLPVIVKLLRGTQGIGVMLATTMTELETLLPTLRDLGQELLIQQFVAESRGKDVRVLVVGDQAVAAMRRTARKGEFRSNLHRGGAGVAVQLPETYAQLAVQAARCVGLRVAGVDLLEGNDGPCVMEVNSSPGFEGLEKATGLDIAGCIMDEALRCAQERPPQPSREADR